MFQKGIFMSKVVHLSGSEFNEFIKSTDKTVVIDFWAQWCGPCKAIAPLLDDVSVSRQDVVIAKVDIDQEKDLAKKFGIRSIPTMMAFKDGEPVATKVGAVNKSQLNGWLDAI